MVAGGARYKGPVVSQVPTSRYCSHWWQLKSIYSAGLRAEQRNDNED